jgi:amino-acid N-acetyltransferase
MSFYAEEKMKIRPARAKDQMTITTMVRGARLNPIDLRWQRFLVAEDETGIVGAVQIRLHGGTPELASLVVRGDQRGRGIGSQLIQSLVTESSQTLYLFCRPELKDYYARFGFRAIGVKEAPRLLRVRYAIGRLITRLVVRRPILMMKRTSPPAYLAS